MGTGDLTGGGGANIQGNEVNQSRQCSAVVKNEGSYTSTPSTCLHAMDKDNEVHFIQTDRQTHTHTHTHTRAYRHT